MATVYSGRLAPGTEAANSIVAFVVHNEHYGIRGVAPEPTLLWSGCSGVRASSETFSHTLQIKPTRQCLHGLHKQ